MRPRNGFYVEIVAIPLMIVFAFALIAAKRMIAFAV